jgi:DNA-binding MarR family transcriptional regulator
VATSGATLFRSIGGSVGTAILGSIFSNRLSSELATSLPRGATFGLPGVGSANPAALKRLPAPIHSIYIHAFTNALSTVFAVAAGVAAVAFVLSWALRQLPLRDSIASASGVGESFAMPKQTDSLAEASRALTALIGREGRRELVQRMAQRAGVDLSPAACWLIVRLQEDARADVPALCAAFDIPVAVGQRALEELETRGLIITAIANDGRPETHQLTPAAEQIAQSLVDERRASLDRLCAGWAPDQHAELAAFLTRLARELAREPPVEVGAKTVEVGAQA